MAEQLGPERSADFAAGRATWSQDEMVDALLQTADGRAFGGREAKSLFGGFLCDSCARKPAGEGCGLLFRSAHAARLHGQRRRLRGRATSRPRGLTSTLTAGQAAG